MDPYLGEIRLFAGNYAPQDWVLCDGRLLSIADYQALFSLIGTTYGGDGAVNFGIPNLNGRIVAGTGQPPGSPNAYPLAQKAGTATVVLDPAKIPGHTHALLASTSGAETTSPGGNVLADPSDTFNMYIPYVPTTPMVALADNALLPTGGSQAHENRMPSLVLNYIMSVNGIYPMPD